MTHEPIPLDLWPMQDRLISVVLALCLWMVALIAAFFEPFWFGKVISVAVGMAAFQALREDFVDLRDALLQHLPKPTRRVA